MMSISSPVNVIDVVDEISANYREACRSRSNAEFISKIEGGLQELEETIYWLELLIESELVPAQKLNSLMQEADELIAILVTCVKNIKQDKNDRKRMKDEKVDG